MYRTCVPAEPEPLLNSSSCYPLVNFTHPFCQNHGVTLPNYVYATPSKQFENNNQAHTNYNGYLNWGPVEASIFLKMEISSVKKCVKNLIVFQCRVYFPSCDTTQSVFRKRKVCRESCLEFTDSCGRGWKLFEQYMKALHPDDIHINKEVHCELQPHRNAGDSPECWYFNRHTNTAGNINNDKIIPVCLIRGYIHSQKRAS